MSDGMTLRFAAFALVAAGSVLAVACATEPGAPSDAALIEQGRAMASSQCAECHAVGAQGASPNESAPPLRTVFDRTYRTRLAEQFRNGLPVGHDDMPRFEFTSDEITALMAYLQDIEE